MNQKTGVDTIVPKSINLKKMIMWIITILVPLSIFLIPTSENFTAEIRMFFIITLIAIFMWAFELMHFIIPSLMLPVFYMLANLAPADKIFLPWSSYIPWMLIAGMILTNIFDDSGLLKRISYWSILKA